MRSRDGSGPWGCHVADWLCCSVGVSLLTQMLYALVFMTRYLDIFSGASWAFSKDGALVWNMLFKLFYLGSAFYIVFIMMKVFPRTRERERAWKIGIWSVLGSLVLAPPLIFLLENDVLEKTGGRGWFPEVGATCFPLADLTPPGLVG